MGAWRDTERAALPALVVLSAALALLAAVGFRAHAPIAGAMAIAAAPLAAVTILLVRSDPDLQAIAARAGSIAAAALPGLLVLYFSFNGGGYQMPSQALVATLLATAIALRVALVDRPVAGANSPLLVAAGALLLFAGWTLVSASWSDSADRAAPEFVRALLYALTFLFFGL